MSADVAPQIVPIPGGPVHAILALLMLTTSVVAFAIWLALRQRHPERARAIGRIAVIAAGAYVAVILAFVLVPPPRAHHYPPRVAPSAAAPP